ncbi:iron-sulfur cluster repair di-iron protein [Virgibacillus kimchii]
MQEFTKEHSPAEIVKVFPKASDLFKAKKIDFCCGGDRPLHEVIAEKNLDETMIMTDLNSAYEAWSKEDHNTVDWDSVSLSNLIDYIVENHHAYLHEELAPLGQFVTKVFRRHGTDNPHLKELHRLFNDFKVDMEEHLVNEEDHVFPLIREYEENPSEELKERIIEANGGLEDDHQASGYLLKKMREITNDFTLPLGACNSYRITYARLEELESNTFQHIHLENNILFKRI